MSWKTVDTAPRDGTLIIGRFAQKDGQELAEQMVRFAVWSESEDNWATAQTELELNPNFDLYFGTSWSTGTMTGWMPLPEPGTMTDATEPPKDKVFLGDFGYPWPLLGLWSAECNRFIYAELQISIYQGKHDPYFETEVFCEASPRSWMPLPCPAKGYAP